MIRREGNRMVLSGALTLGNAAELLRQGKAAIGDGASSVEFGEVGELDSSALALLLAWQREARRRGRALEIAGLPQGLTTIARLYGVAEVLTASPAAVHH